MARGKARAAAVLAMVFALAALASFGGHAAGGFENGGGHGTAGWTWR